MNNKTVFLNLFIVMLFLLAFIHIQETINSKSTYLQFRNKENFRYSDKVEQKYSSFFGGSDLDYTYSSVLDDSNNLYLVGLSDSPDLPTTPNTYLSEKPTGTSIFLSKFSNDVSVLLFSTWLGTAGHNGWIPFRVMPTITLDLSNNIIVSGTTNSKSFPTTSNAFNQSFSGNRDIFLSILSNDGSTLLYSTFLGGSGEDNNGGLGIDKQGNIYITGMTDSTDFPTTSNAFDQSFNGKLDFFVSKFSSNGLTLKYSTFLGGADTELSLATVVAFDSLNNLILGGSTLSSDYPITNISYDSSYGGGTMFPPGGSITCCGDITISKISENGTNLLYSTFIGGSSGEKIHGIVTDETGNIYITGSTKSVDYPITENAFDTTYNGDSSIYNFMGDGFVTKLSTEGLNLIYSTFIGDSDLDIFESITIDARNRAVLTGLTRSQNFPLTGEESTTKNNDDFNDLIFVILSEDGTTLNVSVKFEGGHNDNGNNVNIDSEGNAVIVGWTQSIDFPIKSGYTHTFLGAVDLIILKIEIPDISSSAESTTDESKNLETITGFLLFPLVLSGLFLLKRKKV